MNWWNWCYGTNYIDGNVGRNLNNYFIVKIII